MSVSHKTLAAWYGQLAQLIEAGTALAGAIRIAGGPPARSREHIAKEIEQGKPIDEILASRPKWLPKTDSIFICAAMETGRLPQTLRSLSERHERIRKNKTKVISGIAYPIAIFHISALVLPLTSMINFEEGFVWNPQTYLSKAGLLLIPCWALMIAASFLSKSNSSLLPRILRSIPLLRGYSKSQSLADFSMALSTFIETGIPIQNAWYGAACICKDPAISKATNKLKAVFSRGEGPESALASFKCFPPYFVAFYKSGAQSGKLDETLQMAARQFQTEAEQKMSLAVIVYPAMVFAIVAGVIIYSIFQVYGGYLKMLYDFGA
ncbi:MAG: type II secretion system F family protein [Verrucomicrobiota bacterium]